MGTSCIQLCRESGIAAIATAGSPEKLRRCRELGAVLAIDYKTEDFAEIIKKSPFKGVDMILDPVGGAYLERNVRVLKTGGRLVLIGIMGGRKAELDMGLVLMKSLRILGSRLRSRSLDERIRVTQQFRERFLPLLVEGKLTPVIDRTMPVTEAEAAHDIVARNENLGKVILTVPS